MISDLPRDLAEEVLFRIPVTSLRGVRSTCKKWNTLSKDGSFTRRHIGKEEAKKKQRKAFHVVMMLNYRVSLFSVNLRSPTRIKRVGQLISMEDADRVGISNIFHCDGLLLCTPTKEDISRLVVWNPCSSQTWSVQPRNSFNIWDRYALGYDELKKNHKVLRFVDVYDYKNMCTQLREFEIYSFGSNSWKVLDVNPDWDIEFVHRGLSLQGNTYWFARDKVFPAGGDHSYFLLCFDFTTERFGPRLPLPFHPFVRDTVALSSVGEKQLAVLFQRCSSPYTLKIWISSKIEPNAVSWNKSFLKVDMKPYTGYSFCFTGGSFFVDERKKVAVVLDKNVGSCNPTRNIAHIIGKKGYFKKVDLGKSRHRLCWPLGCSYVPSSVQINQNTA
ncbi:PREDICTED: F-box protein At2g18780-like isoform X1 [Camelina sativa]|uniref:F-box protein At2g18780-like isoform X1 n=1 Tax=Camelina sativa TaxID=90675 RepID=A0ABM0XQE9_CAMSA|nr:PREDICTED: F-box protein At2g18780-like isoform X2 [Camelina sativa]XP_010489360.1 PREDICTED: F-box protein At2g18780-like isoform X1 [Camelina sativa]